MHDGVSMVSPRVKIVADSSISLPRVLLEQHGIIAVPMEVAFEDRVYRDGVDIDTATFYEYLKRSPTLPTTSAPPPASFLEAFTQAAREAPSILCLALASGLSATHHSAIMAKEMAAESLPEVRIHVMDTKTAAAAEALLALEAARAAARGATLEEVVQVVNELVPRVYLVGFLDTLYYLGKGGRIPKVAAWVSTLLNIKPLLEFAHGSVRPLGRPRTTRRAVARLLAIMEKSLDGRPAHVIVVHAAAHQEAERLHGLVAQKFSCRELFVSEFAPVIGAHTGPGLVGCAFFAEP